MAKIDPTDRTVSLTLPEAAAGRLDAFLGGGALPGISRSRAKALILAGHVSIDGVTVAEARHTIRPGSWLVVVLPPVEPAEPEGEAIALDIVYEDTDLIVIDKPAGLVVHPAAGNRSGTLVNALIAHCGTELSGIGGVARPGIVHRLDKDTTGLMVIAKSDRAHQGLAAQFADHGRTGPLERAYLALAWGMPERAEGTIEASLTRSSSNREKMAVTKTGGRVAITHYRVLERYGQGPKPIATLIECRLETGRTHQIRVHLAEIGHPVIGDRAYGAGFLTKVTLLPQPARGLVAAFPRQALHAYLLGFEHPVTGEEMRFQRPPPGDMAEVMAALAAI